MHRWFLALACTLTACAQSASHASASAAPTESPWPLASETAPLWSSDAGSPVGLADGVVVAQTPSALIGLDAQTGRMRWHHGEPLRTLFVGSEGIFAADTSGGVERLSLQTGSMQWHTDRLCPPFRTQRPRDRASFGTLAAAELYVGCEGGTLVQIDPASGAIENLRQVFKDIDNYTDVRSLGYGGIAATAWSSGAFMFQHTALLRASTLSPIVADRTSTDVLGTIGPTLYVFDWCCGMKELADAGALLHVDLDTGRVSDPVDLTPSPLPSRRPSPNNDTGSAARLIGSEVYHAAPPMFYDRGPAAALWKHPHVLYSTLAQMVEFLPEGRAVVQYTDSNDRLHVDLVDLTVRPPRVVFHLPMDSAVVDTGNRLAAGVMVDHDATRTVVALQAPASGGALVLRLSDGRAISAPCDGNAILSDGKILICGTHGSPVVPDVTAYRFP